MQYNPNTELLKKPVVINQVPKDKAVIILQALLLSFSFSSVICMFIRTVFYSVLSEPNMGCTAFHSYLDKAKPLLGVRVV